MNMNNAEDIVVESSELRDNDISDPAVEEDSDERESVKEEDEANDSEVGPKADHDQEAR